MNKSTSRFQFILTITCYLATVMVNDNINDDIKMHLHCGPFRRPCRCGGAIQMALPDAACPGLPQKPLDAAIGQLLAPYCPSGRQSNRQTNNNQQIHLKKMARLMAAAVRRYNTAHIVQWRRSRALLEATGCHHWASIMSDNINWTWLRHFFLMFSLSKP
jgi:hypothetical protein